jgi:murein DD-endopeptidase MepM/ murein hydrolase activator NlpD
VKVAGKDPVFGEYVLLAHNDGLESFYGHASRVLVKVGEPVARGEVIALTGATGKTDGPGLHFEIRKNGEAVDPMLYVKQK